VRYEEIVADPGEKFAEILQGIGLPWTREFEAGFGRYLFSTGRAEAFRGDLSKADLAVVESLLDSRLAGLGYR
jgi:hypothetical protein